jgi:hypothetical protein
VVLRLTIAPVPNSVVVTAEFGLAEAASESIQSVNSISRGQIEQRAPTVLVRQRLGAILAIELLYALSFAFWLQVERSRPVRI